MKVLNTFSALRQKLSTTQGKKFLQFSMFVLIAFIFWASLTLNETFIYDIRYPVKVTNVPDSVTIISEIPNSIKINVKAKGYYFFKNKLKYQKNYFRKGNSGHDEKEKDSGNNAGHGGAEGSADPAGRRQV